MNEGGAGGQLKFGLNRVSVKCCAISAEMGRGHVGSFWLQFGGLGPGVVDAPGV